MDDWLHPIKNMHDFLFMPNLSQIISVKGASDSKQPIMMKIAGALTHPPGQNGRHSADGIFKRIFLNEDIRISMQISMKFVSMGLIDNSSALVQVMAWRRTGDRPFYLNQCWPSSLTHICGFRGRWLNTRRPEQNGGRFADDNFKCI